MPGPGVAALSVAWVLADDDSGGGEAKKAGPIALAVILVLCVACYFLFRSMTRHLRKVREDFPVDHPAPRNPAPPPDRPSGSAPRPANRRADEHADPDTRRVNGTTDKPPS